jgi:serine/threonine-protein kinase SRPK3
MARLVPRGYVGTFCAPLCNLQIASSCTTYHAASDHKHVTLKIGTPQGLENELKALRHFRTIRTNHAGSLLIRQLLDEFQVNSKNGIFYCLVHPPLAISVKTFKRFFPERALPHDLLKMVLKHLLLSLDFLHTEAKLIHTGTSNNTP